MVVTAETLAVIPAETLDVLPTILPATRPAHPVALLAARLDILPILPTIIPAVGLAIGPEGMAEILAERALSITTNIFPHVSPCMRSATLKVWTHQI